MSAVLATTPGAADEACNLEYTDCWGGTFNRTWICTDDLECCVFYSYLSPAGCVISARTDCCGPTPIPSPVPGPV